MVALGTSFTLVTSALLTYQPRTYPARFPLFAQHRIRIHPLTALAKTSIHYRPEAQVAADHLSLDIKLNSAWLETEHKLPVTPCPARGDL